MFNINEFSVIYNYSDLFIIIIATDHEINHFFYNTIARFALGLDNDIYSPLPCPCGAINVTIIISLTLMGVIPLLINFSD